MVRRRLLRRGRGHAGEPDGAPCPPQPYPLDPTARPMGTVIRETLARSGPSPAVSWHFEDQPVLWREAMAALGKRLETWGVAHVALVHGTFVGDDPFSILAVVRSLVPGLRPETDQILTNLARSASRQVLRDHGNFLPEYAELLGRGLASTVRVDRFSWSAGNHHLARLEAAFALAEYLDASVAIGRGRSRFGPRILLVGHSHAGQVFALFVQLLAQVEHVPELLAVAEERGVDVPRLRGQLERLRQAAFDVVTLGTPPRYGWPSWPGYRLVHLINHRGSTLSAGSIRGILHTVDGDYIQQWGIAGSDLPATDPEVRRLNVRLDRVLGVGVDAKAWRANVRAGVRVPAAGTTLLVDYRDGSRLRPNAIETFFGHAVYTRKQVLLFNFERIAEQLYPEPVSRSAEGGRRLRSSIEWLRRVWRK